MDEAVRARLPSPEQATHFWWLRHARVPEASSVMYGSLDVDCDVSNETLFRQVAKRLPREAHWVTSPMKRAMQTADALEAAGATRGEREIDPDIAEMNFGSYNGLSLRELFELREDAWIGFWPLSPHEKAPDGESFDMLTGRVQRFVDRMQSEHRGGHVVCVAHRGTILAALRIALQMPLDTSVAFDIGNVSVTRLTHHADVPEGGPRYRIGDVGWLPA